MTDSSGFFVGIGAQKAGTSWLADYFDSHPEVGFSPIKELHYFDAIYRRDFCGGYEKEMSQRLAKLALRYPATPTGKSRFWLQAHALRVEMSFQPEMYREYFDFIRRPEHRTVGEITPSYSMMNADGFAAIRELMPAAKFIYILRDPLSRYLSQIRFRQSQRPDSDFEAANDVLKHLYDRQYELRTDYGRTLSALETVAPVDDLCVVFYEHLMSPENGGEELRRITDFLDISYQPGDVKTRVNQGMSVDFRQVVFQKIVQRFARVYEDIFDRYGERVPAAWRDSYELLGGPRSGAQMFYQDSFKSWLIPTLQKRKARAKRLVKRTIKSDKAGS